MTSRGQEKMSHPIARASDEITIGVDISKDRLDVHVHPEGIARRFPNDREGHIKLMVWIMPYKAARIVFEATGRYHRAEKSQMDAGCESSWRGVEKVAARPRATPYPPGDKTERAVDGINSFLSGRDRGQVPKPPRGASKTPGLKPVEARGTIEMAVLVVTR
jgi:hypothetical protein